MSAKVSAKERAEARAHSFLIQRLLPVTPRKNLLPVKALLLVTISIMSLCHIGISNVAATSDILTIKIANLYETTIDYFYPLGAGVFPGFDRPLRDIIKMLQETRTQMIFRSFLRTPGRLWVSSDGRTEYEELSAAFKRIRDAIPEIHIMGALSCRLIRIDDMVWPGNRSRITENQLRRLIWILPNGTVLPGLAQNYRDLDMMKPDARDFIVEWAKLQVDAGVDSIHLDEPQYVASRKRSLGLLADVSDYYIYWKDVVERIRAYAMNKYGKLLLINANNNRVARVNELAKTPQPWPFQDFLSVSFRGEDFESLYIQDDWTGYKKLVRDVYGHDIPILAFLDWGAGTETPLARFASLPISEQIHMLEHLHESCVQNNIVFVYPLYGGYAWQRNMTKYDSVAAGTYQTIKKLALSIQETITSTHSMRTTSAPAQTTQRVPSPATDATTVYTLAGLAIVVGVTLFASAYRKKKRHCHETSVKKGPVLLR